jgi:hypothetical protein
METVAVASKVKAASEPLVKVAFELLECSMA